MNEIVINEINIEDMIYEISGKYVMLDSDLAKLYRCKNGIKEVNQAVSRNIIKFPDINHAGSKTFSINILEDKFFKIFLIKVINKLL